MRANTARRLWLLLGLVLCAPFAAVLGIGGWIKADFETRIGDPLVRANKSSKVADVRDALAAALPAAKARGLEATDWYEGIWNSEVELSALLSVFAGPDGRPQVAANVSATEVEEAVARARQRAAAPPPFWAAFYPYRAVWMHAVLLAAVSLSVGLRVLVHWHRI